MESKKKVDSSFDEIRKIVDKALSDSILLEYMNEQEQETEEDVKDSIVDDLKDYILNNEKKCISLW